MWFDDDGIEERYHMGAVKELVDRHTEEYNEIAAVLREERAQSLENEIYRLQDQIRKLRAKNPENVNVPALQAMLRKQGVPAGKEE